MIAEVQVRGPGADEIGVSSRINFFPAGPESGQRDEATPLQANRAEVLGRSFVRSGWIAVVAGLLFPIVALWGAIVGYQLSRGGHPQGRVLLVAGSVVFLARFGLYLALQ